MCGKATTKIRGRRTDRVSVISESVNGWQRRTHNWSDRVHWTVRQIGYQIGKDDRCDIEVKYDRRRVRVLEMGLLARGRLRWRSVDQKENRDQKVDRYQQGNLDKGGDLDRDRRSRS